MRKSPLRSPAQAACFLPTGHCDIRVALPPSGPQTMAGPGSGEHTFSILASLHSSSLIL